MNTNLKKWLVLAALLLAVPFLASCQMANCDTDCASACCDEAPAMLCDGCGEVKGSDECCKDAPTCDACGLHKGSPGCKEACAK